MVINGDGDNNTGSTRKKDREILRKLEMENSRHPFLRKFTHRRRLGVDEQFFDHIFEAFE